MERRRTNARRSRRAVDALFRETIALGGTLSGEHGIGILKAPYLPLEQSPELIALQERVKALFDPQGILNPGKIFPAHVRASTAAAETGACARDGLQSHERAQRTSRWVAGGRVPSRLLSFWAAISRSSRSSSSR